MEDIGQDLPIDEHITEIMLKNRRVLEENRGTTFETFTPMTYQRKENEDGSVLALFRYDLGNGLVGHLLVRKNPNNNQWEVRTIGFTGGDLSNLDDI